MSSHSLASLIWGPGVIGYTVSAFMYGATLGQVICYIAWFPNDPWHIKVLVFMMFVADTIHMIGSTQLAWAVLVVCHQDHSWTCEHGPPQGGYILLWLTYVMIFGVQSFYCRRIWTISGKNKRLTFTIFTTAILGFVFGIWYNINLTRAGTMDYLLGSPLILPFAIASTLCDFLITSAIFKYMWKSGFRRQRTVIQDLAVVCINTGAFTCAMAVVTGIVYVVQGHHYWVGAVGVVIGRSYVNSMLAVLNARKMLRDRDVNDYEMSALQVPTL